jgi:PAS domain S-box-containing protein
MIQRWPTPSRTAETLLVRRDGHDALFLNELKFQTNTALKLRIPLESTNVPAVKAALGQQGIVEGADYRGEAVVAALRAIPDSPWVMVARMDTAELYAPLRERLWLTVLLMGALLLGAGACVGLVWRQQRVQFYRKRAETADVLRASEVRYRRLFETAKDGILILETETGKVVDANPFLAELLGFSREAFLGKQIWELGFFKDIVANQAHFEELQRKEYIRYENMPLETSDGRSIEVEFVSNVYLANHHKMIQCNIRDNTAHNRMAKALATSEARYRRFFEAARDGILILDTETGMVMDVNPFLVERLGFSREEFFGKKVWELGFLKDIAANQAHFAELQQQGHVRYEDMPLHTSDGRRIEVEFVSNVYEVDHKKVMQCNIRDLTERRITEAKLHVSEERFRQITENVADLIALLDLKGRRVYNSPSYRDLLAGSDLDVGADSFLQIHPADQERIRRIFAQTVSTGVGQRTDYRLIASDGSVHYVESQGSVIREGSGQIANVLVVSRDVTERKSNEVAMQRMQAELEQSNRDLQRRNQEVQAFYHTLSHELKTPLTSAREFVSIVMDGLAGPLTETQLEYLSIAKESCDQLRLYINDLLDVTRLETGKMSIEFQALSLATLVERVVEMLAPAAAGKGISLGYDYQPDLPAVPLDQQRIQQVLTNLTTNAIKFTPAGGQIRVSLSESPAAPECLQVAVRDTGRGIPKDQLDLVFNRLYQVNGDNRSAESPRGLGLGLYISQELVQLHGGRIWAESELGQGSTFTFTIPKRQEPATLNVLVVDDEAGIRNTLRQLLEKKGYHVTLAGGGAEALGLMRQQLPALVILDLEMPDMDGAETLEQIRKQWGEIPVVVHTGYPEGDLMKRALKGAPFTVVAKPASPEQVLNTVRLLARWNHETVGERKSNRLPGREDLSLRPVNTPANGLQLEP